MTRSQEARHAMKKAFKCCVAFVGATLVFVGVFFLWGAFINPFLPAIFRSYVHVGDFGTNNRIGAILASLCAASSFRATLKTAK
jgi:hypothetical protein